jgi:hypothetical protein
MYMGESLKKKQREDYRLLSQSREGRYLVLYVWILVCDVKKNVSIAETLGLCWGQVHNPESHVQLPNHVYLHKFTVNVRCSFSFKISLCFRVIHVKFIEFC